MIGDMKTLVVIDMQPFFLNDMDGRSHKPLVNRTASLVREARENGWPVIIVEYYLKQYIHTWSGTKKAFDEWISTDKRIMDELKWYRNKHVVIKDRDDGGRHVLRCIRENKLPCDVVICGVNTSACVRTTASSLVKLGNTVRRSLDMTLVSCCIRNTWQYGNQQTSKEIRQWPVYRDHWENMNIRTLKGIQKVS